MNNKSITLKYRRWFKGMPPQPVKLKIPGWTGCDKTHQNGSKPQPWHCKPFMDGVNYGLELIYPFENETRVYWKKDKLVFDGQFGEEAVWESSEQRMQTGGSPPMMNFAPGHYGMTSSLDLEPEEGYVFRIEPHPSYYTVDDDTMPLIVPANIERWWSRVFFVVFKAPRKDQVHVFTKHMPYAHLLVVPEKVKINVKEMTLGEQKGRENREKIISNNGKKIATNDWYDHQGNNFDDKYAILKREYYYNGKEGFNEKLTELMRGCPYHNKK